MNCINQAIIDCKPAVVTVIGTGTSTLGVLKKENNNCIIEQKVISKSNAPGAFQYYSTCKFPIDNFIKPLEQKQNSVDGGKDLLWMGLSFIKSDENAKADSDGWYQNEVSGLVTGEITKYKCK